MATRSAQSVVNAPAVAADASKKAKSNRSSKQQSPVQKAFTNPAIQRMVRRLSPKTDKPVSIRVKHGTYDCVRAVIDTEMQEIIRRAVVNMYHSGRTTVKNDDVVQSLAYRRD